ncbi:MAG: hypothetical protein JST30_04630 [Armatimonadetes bacterium]|nr:hypothetical protein [Armatimonadota bacterium]
MLVQVSEHPWDVACEALEAVPFALSGQGASSYPWPGLKGTGQKRAMTFPTVVLENGLVSVTVVPGLGGRILNLASDGVALWPLPDGIVPQPWGRRSLGFSYGLTPFFGECDRSGLDPLAFEVFEPRTERSPGGVMTCSLAAPGFVAHVCTTLEPDRADVLVDVHVHNRNLVPARCPVGFQLGAGSVPDRADGPALVWEGTSETPGFALWCEDAPVAWTDGTARLGRCPEGDFFGPRQTRMFRVRLVPLKEPGVKGFERGLAVGFRGANVWAVSSTGFSGTVQVLDCDGRALESPLDIGPGELFAAALDRDAAEVATVDRTGLVRTDSRVGPRPSVLDPRSESEDALLQSSRRAYLPFSDGDQGAESAEEAFWRALARGETPEQRIWGLEHVRAVQSAKAEASAGRTTDAVSQIDQALLTQGDDPLLWWFRAACERRAGEDEGAERSSFLNGRFLAPLDPVFRAEAFLAASKDASVGPDPMVRPLAEDPVRLLEAADAYIGHGLIADAARILDEAQRIRPCPLAGYLLAWCLARTTNMAADALIEVKKASAIGVVPPFPFRESETKAVLEWAGKLPDDSVLAQWAELVRAYVLPRYGP